MKTIVMAAAAVVLCCSVFTVSPARASAAASLVTAPVGTDRNSILVEVGRRGRVRGGRSYRGRARGARHYRAARRGVYRGRRHVRRYAYRHRPRYRYHRRWRRVRPYYYGYSFYLPPVVSYRYVRRGKCAWLHRRWRRTGSHYWRRRYWRCMDRYYW